MSAREGLEGTAHSKPKARLSLIGPFRLRTAVGIEIVIPNRRAKALLGILALSAGQPIKREALSRMLWPGRFDAHAKASLRQCRLDLKKLLEPIGTELIDASRNSLGLHLSGITSDLVELEQALAAGQCDEAVQQLSTIGSAPLLAEMDFGEAFNGWLAAQRESTERRLNEAVEIALGLARQCGDIAGHDALLGAWSARNPTSRAPLVGPGTDTRTRLAVLPFKALNAPDGHDYFADGLVDELITALSQVPQLRVAGRTSSFQFRDTELAIPEIAKALSVSQLIEGSVQRQGEKLRIFVRLIDGMTGFESWAWKYDGSLDDIFTLQEQVAQAVTLALSKTLGLALQGPLVEPMTHSKAAYDLYLQARRLSFRIFGDEVLDNAVKLLDQALELDPDFAEAWLLLGEVQQLIGIYTACLDRPGASTRMATCVARALAIKPNLGQAHVLLGLHELTVGNFVGAIDLAYKGYQIEPNNPAVAMRLGSHLMFCGLTREGLRYVEEAIAQDPIDGRKYMLRSTGHLNCGDIEAAIADGQRAVDLGFASVWLAVATAAAGRNELAVEQYQKTRLLLNKTIFPPAGTAPMSPEMMDAYWLVAAKGVCSGRAEDRETYCRSLDFLQATMHDKADSSIVMPAVFMGYADMVFKAIGEAVTLGNMGALMSIWSDVEPIRQIRQHPEFIPFAQRIGMAAVWDKYGWPDLLPMPSNRI